MAVVIAELSFFNGCAAAVVVVDVVHSHTVVVGVAKTNFHFLIEKETLGQNDRSACLWRISLGSFSIIPPFT